jgi:hypothetical protein
VYPSAQVVQVVESPHALHLTLIEAQELHVNGFVEDAK